MLEAHERLEDALSELPAPAPVVKTTRLPPASCPSCGKKLDAATHPTEDVAPSPGDVTICLGCQDLLIFTEELGLRRPTEAEIQALPLDEISRYQRALNELKGGPASRRT